MSLGLVNILLAVGAALSLAVLHPLVDLGLVLLAEEVEAFRPVERLVQRVFLGSWEEVRLWQWLFATPTLSALAVGPAYWVLTYAPAVVGLGAFGRYLCALAVVYVTVRSGYAVLSLLGSWV